MIYNLTKNKLIDLLCLNIYIRKSIPIIFKTKIKIRGTINKNNYLKIF